jgi:ribosomal protein S18 acetylase RimI-like enzyme
MIGDRPLRLTRDPWLGGILDREAYRLDVGPAGAQAPDEREAVRSLLAGDVFVFAKAAVADLEACHLLECLGFRLIDTNVQLEKSLAAPAAVPPGVREARPDDEEAVAGVAEESFRFSRFHLDPLIPRKLANRVKAEWVRSYFRGARGAAMLVAECEGRVVGFLQALRAADGAAVIDLSAVHGRAQRRGLARALCLALEGRWPGTPAMRVGTQVANFPSLQLYHRLGYAVAAAQYVFHHHGARQAAAGSMP